MENHQHCHATLGKRPHGLQGGVLVQRVKHRGGFVQQQYLPAAPGPELRQHPRQVHALALTTGKRQVAATGQMTGIRRVQRLRDDFGIPFASGVVRHTPHGHDLLDAEGKVQGRALWQHGQASRTLRPVPVAQGTAVKADRSGGSRHLTAQGT
ncbi:hypothetical protein D3C80_1556570 [compost metagenome]